jgi:hypothetical protein
VPVIQVIVASCTQKILLIHWLATSGKAAIVDCEGKGTATHACNACNNQGGNDNGYNGTEKKFQKYVYPTQILSDATDNINREYTAVGTRDNKVNLLVNTLKCVVAIRCIVGHREESSDIGLVDKLWRNQRGNVDQWFLLYCPLIILQVKQIPLTWAPSTETVDWHIVNGGKWNTSHLVNKEWLGNGNIAVGCVEESVVQWTWVNSKSTVAHGSNDNGKHKE